MRLTRLLPLLIALWATLLIAPAASAQPLLSSAQRLANLEAAVTALTSAVSTLQSENAGQAALLQSQAAAISSLNSALASAQASLTQQSASLSALQTALNKEVADRKTYADGVGTSTLASAKTYADGKVAPVADKLIHFSRSGDEVYITGANLNIRNGTGLPYQRLNGLGNLVIGYNDLRASGNNRTGSHNLVMGFQQNYSQAGGLLLGAVNSSAGHYASVLGGTGNTAGGLYAVVVGGYDNQASGNWSSVLGGQGVRAAATLAHVP